MKKTLITAALLTSAVAIAPLAAFAATNTSSGTITINGQIVTSTCQVSVNGSGASTTITLPTVDTGTLNAANSTAGWTALKIALTGCSAVTGLTKNTVLPNFELGANTDATNGYLKNAASGGATNVEIVLSNDQTLTNSVKLNQASGSQNAGTAAPLTGTGSNPTYTYYAAYVSPAGGATAGAVSTSVQYDLVYQ